MPDLHLDSTHAFWDSYDRRVLYRVLVALEKMEHWVVDLDPEINQALIDLGNAIDNNPVVDLHGKEEILIRILANTRSLRSMRIVQALDLNQPGTASQILMYAEENVDVTKAKSQDDAMQNKLFIDRNLVFERLQLISRIFSPPRISLIMKALEYYYI